MCRTIDDGRRRAAEREGGHSDARIADADLAAGTS